MKYGYYPGCSQTRNARSYHESAMEVIKPFQVDFSELDDWNCCGATEYIALDLMAAYALVARNLYQASLQTDTNHQVVTACSACFLNLSKAEAYLTQTPKLMDKINIALEAGGIHYTPGSLTVRHMLDVFVNDIGYEKIAAKVTNPLKGLRVAPYYGCLIVRPAFQGVFDDHEHPVALDRLMKTIGAEVVDFPLKANCCGGHMTQLNRGIAMDLLRRLLQNAQDYHADVIVTLCPMCQLNLDAYQEDVNKHFKTQFNIPVLYFTQLMGLAFGMSPQQMWIGKEFVDARPALAKIGLELPPDEGETSPKKPSKQALPMPQMPEGR